ncbi:hypothetical protein YC2023_070555 [Brassica napus]
MKEFRLFNPTPHVLCKITEKLQVSPPCNRRLLIVKSASGKTYSQLAAETGLKRRTSWESVSLSLFPAKFDSYLPIPSPPARAIHVVVACKTRSLRLHVALSLTNGPKYKWFKAQQKMQTKRELVK